MLRGVSSFTSGGLTIAYLCPPAIPCAGGVSRDQQLSCLSEVRKEDISPSPIMWPVTRVRSHSWAQCCSSWHTFIKSKDRVSLWKPIHADHRRSLLLISVGSNSTDMTKAMPRKAGRACDCKEHGEESRASLVAVDSVCCPPDQAFWPEDAGMPASPS